jgi:hypothetical protein
MMKGIPMAEPHEQSDKATEATFFAAAGKLLNSFRDTVNPVIETVSEPLLRDGFLGSAFRQGVDELFQGMKAFPDSISAVEPGGLMNPLQSEIADARKEHSRPMTLEDILGSNTPSPPQQSHDKDLGHSL